ncbi:hypothetical protein H6G59_01325 [Anabaena lutea FACHB-196]|uniref:Uncharacterized protein n=1 Tax=Anabaena lutea FACHB-196 TaxID=2692881 RepID=A0ABR8F9D3_9NOST|nr:hypothetical protein [Anabaena lutea FACHB-196]
MSIGIPLLGWGIDGLTEFLANPVNELSLPVERISLEMIYCGLYHFSVAHQKGLTDHPINCFAAADYQDLRVVKLNRSD